MIRRVLAALLAFSLVGALSVATAPPSLAEQGPLSAKTHRVPAVESMVGIGSLPTDPAGTVPLLGLPQGHTSALIRVSIFDAETALDVNAAGVPTLHVEAGASGSATTLVPVRDGAVPLSASVSAAARVEVLASFADTSDAGATHALDVPVVRADTTTGLAGARLSAAPLEVGVVGLGGVPARDVRAVYLTATFRLDAPSSVSFAGQGFPLPAGTTAVTTIAVPDADGAIQVALPSGEGDVRVDVRGWVAEAPQDSPAANVEGGYVPAYVAPESVTLAEGEEHSLSAVEEFDTVIALVWGSAAADRAFLGDASIARAQGALADAGSIAPQLLVGDRRVVARGAGVDATILVLGGTLAASAAAGVPAIDVDLDQGSTIDLSQSGWLTLRGSIQSAAAVDRVEVLADGTVVGTAALVYGPSGLDWRFETGAPETGDYQLTARVVTRGGQSAVASRSVQIVLPAEDTAIASPDLFVVPADTDASTPAVSAVSADEVVFSAEPTFAPGAVIASDVAPNAPDGFLRRVTAIDRTDTGWRVHTEPATLTDAIVQAHASDEVDVLVNGAAIDTDVPRRPEGSDVEVVDDGRVPVALVTGDEVETGPYPAETDRASEASAADVAPAESAAARLSVDAQARAGLSMRAAWAYDTHRVIDLTSGSDPRYVQTKGAIEASGGIAMTAQAQLTAQLSIVVDIDAHYEWGRLVVKVGEFSVILTTDARGKAALSAYLQVQTVQEFTAKLADIILPSFTFYIPVPSGAIPVVVQNTMTLMIVADIDAKFSASVEYSIQRTESYGFRYSDAEGVKDVHEGPTLTQRTPLFGEHPTGRAEGKLDATAMFKAELSMKIYGMLGPVFTGGIGPGITAEFIADAASGTLDAKVDLFLQMGLSGRVVFTVPIIDDKLLDQTLFELKTRIPAASWQWSGDRIFDHHPGGDRPDPGPLAADWASVQPMPSAPYTIVDAPRGRLIQYATGTDGDDDPTSPADPRLIRVFDRDALRAVHRAPEPFRSAALDAKSGTVALLVDGAYETTESVHLRRYDPAAGTFGDQVAVVSGSTENCRRVSVNEVVSAPNGRLLLLGGDARAEKGDDGTCRWESAQRSSVAWVVDAATLTQTEELSYSRFFGLTAAVQFSLDGNTAYLFGQKNYAAPEQGAAQVTLPLDGGIAREPEPLDGIAWVDSAATDPRDGTIVLGAGPLTPPETGQSKLATNLWRVDPGFADVLESPVVGSGVVEGNDYFAENYRGVLFDSVGHLYAIGLDGSVRESGPATFFASASGEIGNLGAMAVRGESCSISAGGGDQLIFGLDASLYCGSVAASTAAVALHVGGQANRDQLALPWEENDDGIAITERASAELPVWRMSFDPQWYATTDEGISQIILPEDGPPALSAPTLPGPVPLIDPAEWETALREFNGGYVTQLDGDHVVVVCRISQKLVVSRINIRTSELQSIDLGPASSPGRVFVGDGGVLQLVVQGWDGGTDSRLLALSPDLSTVVSDTPLTFGSVGVRLANWFGMSVVNLAGWDGASDYVLDQEDGVGYLVDSQGRVAAFALDTGKVRWITEPPFSSHAPIGITLAKGGGVWITGGRSLARIDANGETVRVREFVSSGADASAPAEWLTLAQVVTDAEGNAVLLSMPTDQSTWNEPTSGLGYVWRFSDDGELVSSGRLPLTYADDSGRPVQGPAGFRLQSNGTVGWAFNGRSGLVDLE